MNEDGEYRQKVRTIIRSHFARLPECSGDPTRFLQDAGTMIFTLGTLTPSIIDDLAAMTRNHYQSDEMLVRLHRQGHSVRKISAHTNLPKSTVQRRLSQISEMGHSDHPPGLHDGGK